MMTVAKALIGKGYQGYGNPWLKYMVMPYNTNKFEPRQVLINNLFLVEQTYKLTDIQLISGYPVLERIDKSQYFHLMPFERTHFSEREYVERLETEGFFEIESMLSYFFWESSTEVLINVGVPTFTDVEYWIEILNNRSNLTECERNELIGYCKSYIMGT